MIEGAVTLVVRGILKGIVLNRVHGYSPLGCESVGEVVVVSVGSSDETGVVVTEVVLSEVVVSESETEGSVSLCEVVVVVVVVVSVSGAVVPSVFEAV